MTAMATVESNGLVKAVGEGVATITVRIRNGVDGLASKTIDEGANLALKESGRAYYGENLKGSVTASGFGVYTASGTVSNTLNSTLSKHLQKLNKIRLKVPALSKGQYHSYGDLKFVRRYTSGGVDSIAAVAISGGCTFDNLPNGTYEELYNGGTQNVTNGRLNASVSGQGNIQIWVKK